MRVHRLILQSSATALVLLTSAAVAQRVPPPGERVVDGADLLTPAQEVQVAAKLESLQVRRGDELVVLTVATLGGRSIDDWSRDIRNGWGAGRDRSGNGIVLLVAPKENAVRIEFGLGLRQDVTQAEASAITEHVMIPAFRTGAFGAGILAGTDAIIAELDRSPAVPPRP